MLPFAAGNFLGPLLLGRLFDTLGRRPMIAATYALSGLLLAGARLSVRASASARRDRPDHRLDGDLLLRLGGGELGLSHGERDLSARGPRARHRLLLRHRHRHRRRRRALAVRRADRHRLALERVRRLPVRLGADARGGVGRGALRRSPPSASRWRASAARSPPPTEASWPPRRDGGMGAAPGLRRPCEFEPQQRTLAPRLSGPWGYQ